MPHARADGVEIFYDSTGPADADPLVLLAGTGAQLISWRAELVELLVAEGFRVIRIDNRDVGLSTKFGGPRDLDGGYELRDLGDDVLRVLDAEGVRRAHLVGHSMGGMIAQVVAIEHPDRVASLSLLATIPGRDPRYVLHGPLPARPPGWLPRWAAV
ncbi:MAG: alpha/beta fold hydrolase, partial [Protaetiibacter sp.]